MGDALIRIDSNNFERYADRYWDKATVCDAPSCEKVAREKDFYETEIYCGCRIPPEAVDGVERS